MCSLNTTTAVASSIPLYKLFRAAGINPSFLILLAAVLILFAAGENASAKTEGSDAVRNAAGQNQARGYLGPSVDFNWFWVFYERESAGSHATFIVRPFYLKTGTNTSFFQASLMPILFWRYKTPD